MGHTTARWTLGLLVVAALACLLVATPGFAQDDGGDAEQAEGEGGQDGEEGEGAEGEEGEQAQMPGDQIQRGGRMEFDARLIRGERAAGAVFLFQRTPRHLPSMVDRRTSFLDQTVETTLGPEAVEQFEQAKKKQTSEGQ